MRANRIDFKRLEDKTRGVGFVAGCGGRCSAGMPAEGAAALDVLPQSASLFLAGPRQRAGPAGFARTAAGIVALYSAGLYEGPEVDKGLKYLMTYKPGGGGNQGGFFGDYQIHYYYGHYYAAQAMWTAGSPYWEEWYPAIRDELLKHPDRQEKTGCWMDQRICNDYGTAMACIILQIPNNYLPILQK